ncbi:MAG: NADPH:quinone oxidoreductase family protein, partial [Gammaproteobacteria bacterium]|nr:NADPH:quinone oxidoreductase family protein [Gammaproteobacteria bacterium]
AAVAEAGAETAPGFGSTPDYMSGTTGAAFPMVYTTSYYALKQRAQLQSGETLLVLGAGGGVGMAAVELGKIMGARVIAAAGSEEKLAFAQKLGADELVNYGDGRGDGEFKEKVKELTGGAGADVIYDPVGGDLFDQCCRCINWNGRLLVIGFTSGRIPAYKANLALLKGSSMVGVFLGRFRQEEPKTYERNFRELLDMYGQGKIKPLITQRYTLRDYVSAFNVFTERRALGKVILEMKSE